MQNNTKNVCRCCLKLVQNPNVYLLNEVMREMLSLLSIKLDLNVSEHPLVCSMCSGVLSEIYLFKSKCLYTEDVIGAHIETNSKVSLRDILIEIENKSNVHIGEEEVVCRLCMKIPPNCSYIALGETDKEISFSRDMIQIHLPEMDLNVIEKPIICDSCHVCLKSYVSFATNCMAVEEQIKQYCDFQKSGGPVDLAGVRQFTEDKAFDLQTRLSKDVVIKEEAGSIVVKVEKVQDAEDYISGHFEDSSCSVLLLKNEEIEIKSENDDMRQICSNENMFKRHYRDYKSNQNGDLNEHLDEHLIKNNENVQHSINHRIHDCKLCTYKTVWVAHLKQHITCRHRKRNTDKLYCYNCNYFSFDKSNLRKHVLIHSNFRPYQCPSCKKGFIEKRYFDIHVLRCHQEGRDLIKTVSNETQKFNLHEHIPAAHESPGMHLRLHDEEGYQYKCPSCGKRFRAKKNLEDHFLKNHENVRHLISNRIHDCKCCTYKTVIPANLKHHIASIHKRKDTDKLHCYNCNYFCYDKSNLRQHVLRHSNYRPHQCSSCKKGFIQKRCLDLHIVRNHKEDRDLLKTV